MEVEDPRIQEVARTIGRHGYIPDAPDGPILSHFNAKQLAAGIKHELNRASLLGFTKVAINMDLLEAHSLMQFLER